MQETICIILGVRENDTWGRGIYKMYNSRQDVTVYNINN